MWFNGGMDEIETQEPASQAEIDATTYEMYVDCHLNATATARQVGCSATTVKARVRRHALRTPFQA